MAKLAAFQMTVTDDAGNVVPAATVTVRATTAGNPLAVLYSDRAGATPIGNPITTDDAGFFRFHAVGGSYNITATKGSFTRTWNYVGVGTASEYDASNLLFSFPMFFNAAGKLDASEALPPLDIPDSMTLFAADAPNWLARARVGPAVARTISLVKNGVQFATILFGIGSASGVFTMAADVPLIRGDQVWPIMPSTADANLSTISITLVAKR